MMESKEWKEFERREREEKGRRRSGARKERRGERERELHYRGGWMEKGRPEPGQRAVMGVPESLR
jgi:hypothetical protein